jgi:hypothetical protein
VRRNAPQLPVLVLSSFVGDAELDFDLNRTTLELGELELPQTRDLCCAVLGQAELDADFVARVHAAALGRPNRVDACLRRLAEGGWLKRSHGEWSLPAGELAALLASVPTVETGTGLPALPRLASVLVDVLSVLGREVELLQLWRIAGQVLLPDAGVASRVDSAPDEAQSAELFEALRQLEEAHLIEGLDGLYRLSSEHERDEIRLPLSAERSVPVHAAIVTVLEAQLAQSPGDLALLSELATHALAAPRARSRAGAGAHVCLGGRRGTAWRGFGAVGVARVRACAGGC